MEEQQFNDDSIAVASLDGMYKDYFLDYASYVILERAVPSIYDGLKPVQRRILHAMKEMDDGRFHKVANIIGQTMQFHPHGDAAIGDALVNLGQKDLLIDCQGNWGDIRTGDRAAAPRYIEARLTKFALDVAFNGLTTDWQLSYDGRKNEPLNLPMKFPLVLSQGVEGIAVGLSTKILPHNFIELLKASIKILEEKPFQIYPDFQTGGLIDVAEYNHGKRGGKVNVRAKIEQVSKKELAIRELPYGVTTTSLIDSILKANDKGKIKIKRIIDNTAKELEIIVELAPGISPENTEDALYAFTNCQVSISPNACVIIDDKPHFLSVRDLLKHSTANTKALLKRELEIERAALQEKLHFASLEKIFIEKRIYREIEECETWEAVIETIDKELHKYVYGPSMKAKANDSRLALYRDITEEDIVRLTEIKIKRISKFNTFKADEKIHQLNEDLEQVLHHLAHLTDYAIAYFEALIKKYGKGKERKTEITSFENIARQQVVINNSKLYVNRKDGFIGTSLKKEEFVCDCSDIDDIIIFRKDGKFLVTKVGDKTFVGKNILHLAVWKKGDERTTYNLLYLDGKTGRTMAKRFQVKAITRDREYDLLTVDKNSKVLHFSAMPNGEAETLNIQLTQGCTARKKQFIYDFGALDIKGRTSKGNIVTRYPIRKVVLEAVGKSTLGAIKAWMDDVSGRINNAERGLYLGEFDTGDHLLAIYDDGSYEVVAMEMNKKIDVSKLVEISKLTPQTIVSAIYYEGAKKVTLVKRFAIETSTLDQKFTFISEERGTKLNFATTKIGTEIEYSFKAGNKKNIEQLNIDEFIDIKGWKSMGNKLLDYKILSVKITKESVPTTTAPMNEALQTGDTIDFSIDNSNQTSMFD